MTAVTFVTRATMEEALRRIERREEYGLTPEVLREIADKDRRKSVRRAAKRALESA
jgi:hypothetical protein